LTVLFLILIGSVSMDFARAVFRYALDFLRWRQQRADFYSAATCDPCVLLVNYRTDLFRARVLRILRKEGKLTASKKTERDLTELILAHRWDWGAAAQDEANRLLEQLRRSLS
jgi:hypothetical protein